MKRVVLALVPVVFLSAALATSPNSSAAQTAPRPNILVIVTDDQRVGTMGVMPKARAIFGAGGVRYPNAFATTPLCCPARASIMTGRYVHNHKVLNIVNPFDERRLDQLSTVQRYLKDAGYRTGMFGKYFNAWKADAPPPAFDRWTMSVLTSGYYPYYDAYFNVDGTVRQVSQYTTDFLATQTVGAIQDFEADDARPWFLYVAPTAPHKTYVPSEKYAQASVSSWNGNPAVFESDRTDKPPWVQSRTSSVTEERAKRKLQLRMLMSVDDLVGRVFEKMNTLGEGNTLAIYLSDNGFFWGEHGLGGDMKRMPYTASVQIPMYVRWPGHLAGGTTDGRLATNVDVTPTVLSAAGVSTGLRYPLDGRSLLSRWSRERVLLEYWRSPDWQKWPTWGSIRTRTAQYVEWYDDAGKRTFREYYDLKADPWQLVNLLGDGSRSNDPDVSGLAAQLAADRLCEGSHCP